MLHQDGLTLVRQAIGNLTDSPAFFGLVIALCQLEKRFGPQMVGIMSDLFAAEYGKESLRMALFVLSFLNLWCAYHYYLAGRYLRDDLVHIAPESR